MTARSPLGLLARLLALLLALTLVAAACGGDDGDDGAEAGDDTADDDDGGDDDADGTGDQEGDAGGNVVEGEGEAVVEDTETAVTGGTLRIGVEAETDGLNPTANNFAVSAYTIGYAIFEPLFYFDENGDWFPWLAESATPVGDGSSWQIKVREGIFFHDGVELNADALIRQFQGTLADPIISIAVRPSFPEENPVEKIDDYTVQYNLVRPDAQFPTTVASQLGMIASPQWLDEAVPLDGSEGDESANQRPVGTGPFELESRDQDNVTRVVRNENYWQGVDDIYLDAIEFFIETDMVIAAERLAAGDLDLIVTSTAEATLTLRDADGASVIENNLSGEDFVMMNTSRPPMDDLRVRQALTFATDRQGYVDLIGQGVLEGADSMYHPDLIWNNPDVVQEANDPDRATPLIEAYCAEVPDSCSDGKVNIELQFSGPSTAQDRIMALLSDGWSDHFNVTLQQLLQDDHITEVAIGQYDVVTWRQFGEAEPNNEVVWLTCDSAEGLVALNWPRLCSPERDELLYAARASSDQAERVELMQQVQENVNAAYTYVFLTHANWAVGFRDEVKNVCGQKGPGDITLVCNSQGRGFYHNVWIDEG